LFNFQTVIVRRRRTSLRELWKYFSYLLNDIIIVTFSKHIKLAASPLILYGHESKEILDILIPDPESGTTIESRFIEEIIPAHPEVESPPDINIHKSADQEWIDILIFLLGPDIPPLYCRYHVSIPDPKVKSAANPAFQKTSPNSQPVIKERNPICASISEEGSSVVSASVPSPESMLTPSLYSLLGEVRSRYRLWLGHVCFSRYYAYSAPI